MMHSHLLRNLFTLYFADQGVAPGTPDPGAAGGAGAAPGTAPPGQGQPQQGDEAFWGLFPNVPQEHRALLAPHIQEMQRHVTQLEAQSVPLRQAGYTPETIQGLVNFDQRFQRDPVNEWLQLGQMLQQQQGQQGRPILDPEIDLDHLAALARGEDPDAGQPPGSAEGVPGGQQGQEGIPPQLRQYIQGLEAKIEELSQGFQQDRTARTEQVQDRLFQDRLGKMRDALKQSGWPEELLSDQELTAKVITYRGDFRAAATAMIDQRTALLKGVAAQRTTEPEPAAMPNGAPPSPSRREAGRKPGDPWGAARKGAESRLARANRPQE